MSVVELDEAKEHLNLSASATTHNIKLQKFIDRAESRVQKRCGPLTATNVTERVRGARSTLSVAVTPILGLTSITPAGGSALDLASFTFDKGHAGTIGYLHVAGSFAVGWYDVAYSAGWAASVEDVPDDLKLGVLELVSWFWETQRVPTTRPGTPSKSLANTLPDSAYALPFRVEQLLIDYMRPEG